MANIQNITNGMSSNEVVTILNELIAAVNALINITDYEQLSNKPSINGIVLSGNKRTNELDIELMDINDTQSILDNYATVSSVTGIENIVKTLVIQEITPILNEKLNVETQSEVKYLDGSETVHIMTDDGVKKIKIDTLISNINYKASESSLLDNATKSQLKLISIEGLQDGNNVKFNSLVDFMPTTTQLFLNGQKLINGVDYIETGTNTIEFITFTPISTDRIQLLAIYAN